MKKILSRKFKIVTVLFLACVMITGIGVSYAWFSDKDTKTGVQANMATVDIALKGQAFDQSDNTGTVSFAITNNSNIDIYLRAGVIFELEKDEEPVIADTSGISVATSSQGWIAEQKTSANGTKKWFLEYGDGTKYTEVNPGANSEAEFAVTGIPDGCKLIVNVVPEAVQVDVGNDALTDFKNPNNVNPAW